MVEPIMTWHDVFIVGVICAVERNQHIAEDASLLGLYDSVRNSQLRSFWAVHKPAEIPGWNTQVRSTKVCSTKVCSTPGCGNTHLMLLRTMNEKWCPDCGKSTAWGLEPGQKALA